jgi:DNA-binding beta-propeller fold protein YncE
MDDTSNSDDLPEESVLRPFEPSEAVPLPPVEPSKVVPEPPAVAEELPSPPPPPPSPIPVAPEPSAPTGQWAPEAQPVAAESDIAETVAIDPTVIVPNAVDEVPDALDDEADAAAHAGAPVAGSLPDAVPATETITLPRKPFLIGLGVLLAALALFAVLWQTAGSDGADSETVEAPPSSLPVVDTSASTELTDELEAAARANEEALTDAQSQLATTEDERASLAAQVEELSDRPPPALSGNQLRRVVVGADAKFVDALDDSVAVVGAFGGVSLIDPATNRVVANGNVAERATRVLRTRTSVWLTNYADNQVLQVDPSTNTVATTFSFIGPDGIEKDGNSLVIASFDGGSVARVQPDNGDILQLVDVGGKPTAILSSETHGLWVAVFDTGEVVKIDRESFEIVERVIVGQGPVGLAVDETHLWVTNHDENTIAKVDPSNAEVVWTAVVGNGPTELVSVNGSVWVTVTDDGALVEVDAESGEIRTRTPLGGASAGGGPTGISYADGSLWIAMQGEQSVVRVDIG